MKKRLLLILFLPGVTCGAYATNHNAGSNKGNFGLHIRATGNTSTAAPIKVTVRDNTGQPLPGVTVKIKGTGVGGQTDVNGAVTINAQIGDILVFSYIGYVSQETKLVSGADVSIVLAEDSKLLGEVVVTALGIKKERRSLGYSVSEVKGEDLTKAREPNFVNALVGKVAGVNVSNMSGGPGASTNIVIRGTSSISQTNQPLYVVNGVPMESQPGGVASYLSGKGNNNGGSQYDNSSDNGDAISNINPDDIESISVLKGAAAAALYGSRAKAGVILITTKTAKSNSVEFNSNYVAETIIDPTHWQYQYGQGATNTAPKTLQEAFQSGQSSYGAPFSGATSAVQFDGVTRPYVAQKGNLDKFYRTGNTLTNTVALNRMFEGGSVRLSASDMHNNSVVPNSGLNRQTFDLNGNYDINKHLVISARANYILEQGNNRPYVGDGAGNPNFNAWFLPTSIDINTLKGVSNGSIANGNEYGYSANTYATNPWFAAQNFVNNTKRVRLLSNVSLRYNFDGGAFIQGRVGSDTYNDRITGIVPTGTAYRLNGSISEESTNVKDITADVLIGKPFKLNDFTITPNAGASYRRTRSESIINSGDNFAVPFVYNLTNAISNKSVNYYPGDLETQAVYGTLEVSYKNLLYITGTGRSDWFSTLATPGKDNKLSKFYPAVSGAFVFSELWHPNWLSNGKLRAGYAGVGQATTPFQTQLSYNLNSATLNGLPLGGIANDAVPNNSLIASYASEFEVGAELGFLNNRITVDMAWYNKKSKDEIVKAPASASSGYSAAVLNIGKLQNKGFELLINGTPFKSTTFTWASSFNGSINNSKVLEIATGTNQLLLATSRSGVGFTQQVTGLPANQVMAYDYAYDASGKIAIDPNTGLPSRGELKAYGSAYAKWIAGFSNTFTYKSVSLSVLVDGKWGGKIFSTTDYYGYVFGLHEATTVNRLGNFGTTATPINAATYYNNLANNVSKLFVQDASFIKFRSVTLGYTLPANLFNGAVKSATISFVGRNLFYIMKKTDNIDPESSYSAFAQGIESGGLPTTRTYGLNLSVKF